MTEAVGKTPADSQNRPPFIPRLEWTTDQKKIFDCVFHRTPLEVLFSMMDRKLFLLASIVGTALFFCGCAGWTGPNGLGQLVLVVCKTSPAQQAEAQKVSNEYFSQVASGKKARPGRRYVAVQTLDPNEKQRGKYVQTRVAAQKKAESNGKSIGSEWPDSSALHCVMVFDVVTHEAVGTNCYVVGSVPAIGAVETYDSFPAEFVASSAELVSH
jgi:hypothetical protein